MTIRRSLQTRLALAYAGGIYAAGVLVLSLVDLPLAGVRSTTQVGQAQTATVTSSGKNRTFILRVPDGYDVNRQYRLVVGFHWRGGTATDVATGQTVQRDVWSYYGLQRLANNSTIFVAPQGLNNGWANAGGEDITFVDDILRRVDAGTAPVQVAPASTVRPECAPSGARGA